VGYFGFAQAGGVVLEGEMLFAFVEAETAEAVGIGKGAKPRELFLRERGLQFVSDVNEGHGRGIIPATGNGSLGNDRLKRLRRGLRVEFARESCGILRCGKGAARDGAATTQLPRDFTKARLDSK
jgi:hypothetical protein